MSKAQTEEQLAVQTGYWHCFRFNPALAAEGKSAFTLVPRLRQEDYQEFLNGEVRYNSLKRANPAKAERLFGKNEQEAKRPLHLPEQTCKTVRLRRVILSFKLLRTCNINAQAVRIAAA